VSKAVFISVKPEFVEKIFSGLKTIELRKSSPKISTGDLVIIYSTSPVMEIVGTCRVKEIISTTPLKLWNQYSDKMGIDKKRYLEYYEGKDVAIGIGLKDKRKFSTPVPLEKFRKKFENFHPPQTFRYIDQSFFEKYFK
jgi:predicted transcriptional regulator